MATKSNVQVNSRSISLPARLHPKYSLKIETVQCLNQSSSPPLDGKLVQSSLKKVVELYNSVDELIRYSPVFTQQSLRPNQQHMKLVENALDTSVLLLDACNNVADVISSMKDQVQGLHSALRRKGGRDLSCMESNIHAYVNFRKKSKRDISRCLRSLKKVESKIQSSFPVADINNLDLDLAMVIKVLRESSLRAILSFQSVLSFMAMPEAKGNGWKLIRKILMPSESRHSFIPVEEDDEMCNEVGSVDVIICALEGQIRKNSGKIDEVQRAIGGLERVDASINGVENGLECLFRRLIQNRVTLLNILTP